MMIVKKNLSFYFGEEERKCQKCDCKEKFIATCFIPGCFSCFHDIEQVIAHFERSGSYLEHRLYDPTKEISFEDLHEILSLTIKEDKVTKLIIFSNCLLAQTESDQFTIINTGGSSEGKTWNTLQIAELFPENELITVGNASPTSFYHEHGILVEERYDQETGKKTYVPLGEELEQLQAQIAELKAKKEQDRTQEEKQVLEQLKRQKSELLGRSKRLVNLSGKILIFLDQPNPNLLQNLRSMISHDSKFIEFHITNRSNKGQNYTEHIVLEGFPSIIFCTAYHKLSEQEITRVFQVSPETTQKKLHESVKLYIEAKGNPTAWERKLESDLARQSLIFRILLVRAFGAKKFNSERVRKFIENRFFAMHRKLQPRNQRDISRLYALIHAHALLNFFNRETVHEGKELEVERRDVDEAFELYSEIAESNEHGVSPEVWEIFKMICDVYERKGRMGLTYWDIKEAYFEKFARPLMLNSLRNQIMPTLLDVGLVTDKENPDDRRQRLFSPKLIETNVPELTRWRLSSSSNINGNSNLSGSKVDMAKTIIFFEFFDRLDRELAQNYDSFSYVNQQKSSSNYNKTSNDNKIMIESAMSTFDPLPKGYCSICETDYGKLLEEHNRLLHPGKK
jgi:hypothetical protein